MKHFYFELDQAELKIQRVLKEIELKHDVEVIYAAECGPKERSLSGFNNAKPEICLVYIRNNKTNYQEEEEASTQSGHLFGTSDDGQLKWAAYDVTDMTDAAVYKLPLMYPTAVEILFASKVHKQSERYPFVEQMRRALLDNPRVSDLVQKYRSAASSTFLVFAKDTKYYIVDFYVYMSVVREVATIQWLKLKFIDQTAVRADKLLETNFTTLLGDLKPHLDINVFKGLTNLERRTRYDDNWWKQERLKKVDEWIVRTLRESYDILLKAQAKEANMPKNFQTFNNILQTNLELKFNATNKSKVQ